MPQRERARRVSVALERVALIALSIYASGGCCCAPSESRSSALPLCEKWAFDRPPTGTAAVSAAARAEQKRKSQCNPSLLPCILSDIVPSSQTASTSRTRLSGLQRPSTLVHTLGDASRYTTHSVDRNAQRNRKHRMSTPGGPPSDAEMRDAEQRTPLAPASNRNQLAGASSPLAFPSSSPLKSQASGMRAPQSSIGASSPLHFPTSSPSARTSRGQRTPVASARRSGNAENRLPSSSSGMSRLDEPLFFPSSGGTTPRHQRRGEIHSSVALSSPSMLRRNRLNQASMQATQGGDTMPSRASSVFGGSQHTADQNSDAISLSQHGVTSDAAGPAQDGVSKVIWGTNVSIGETMEMFRSFLRGFRLKYRWAHAKKNGMPLPPAATANPAEGERLVYEGYLRRMRITDQTNLNLRISDLEAYPPSKRLKMQLIRYPQEMVPIMDQVLKDEMLEMAYEDQKEGRDGMGGDIGLAEIELMETKLYKVRPYGADAINMRDLNPADIDKLVTVRGLVIRATPIIPEMKQAFFRCLVCNHTVPVEIDRGRIAEPDRCPRQVCNLQGSMSLIHNRCEFSDRQVVRIQETPDVVPDGQTPHTVSMCAYDELVDVSKPGDRVEITGIFRSTPVRVNPRQRSLKSLYKTFVDILHIKRTNGKRLGVDLSTRDASEQAAGPGAQAVGVGGDEDDEEVDVQTTLGVADEIDLSRSQDLEDKLRSIADRPDVYELLSRSLAPSIYEMDDVKKGILLQLFGGTNKTISTGGGGGGPRYRGDINVLMVGDPGIAKSQILQYVHKIAPRGVATSPSGPSSTAPTKAVRYVDLAKALNDQSSVPVDPTDLYELVRTLESEGVVKTAGERERKTQGVAVLESRPLASSDCEFGVAARALFLTVCGGLTVRARTVHRALAATRLSRRG
ncbi:hypothetical protein L1887_61798 [Cichorium endivia]|nr:hypothetical protein L1887_61798 [Cichorium endivia]